MNIFSKVTLKTMLQYRTRTLVAIIGVLLSTAMITAVTTFGSSILGFLEKSTKEAQGAWHLAVFGLSKEDAKALALDEEVKDCTVIYSKGYALPPKEAEAMPDTPYFYVNELSEKFFGTIPFVPEAGKLPENDSEILLSTFFQGDFEVGDSITLQYGNRMYQGEALDGAVSLMDGETFEAAGKATYRISGFYSYFYGKDTAAMADTVYIGPSRTPDDSRQGLYIELINPKQIKSFMDRHSLEGVSYTLHGELLRWLGIYENDRATSILNRLMGLLIFIIMGGAVALIYNAFSISLRERTTQFALLSSIGATQRQLRRSLVTEALFVSLIGIPLGILAGVLGIGITLQVIGKWLVPSLSLYSSGGGHISLSVMPSAILTAALASFFTVLISVWIPSRRVRKITPIDALRSSKDIHIRPKEVKSSRLFLRLFGLSGYLAGKYYKRDRKKYRATVFSLTISMTLFVTATLYTSYLLSSSQFVLDAPETDLFYTFYESESPELAGEVASLIENSPYVKSCAAFEESRFYLQIPKELLGGLSLPFASEIDPSHSDTVLLYTAFLILPDEEFERITGLEASKTSLSAAFYNSFRAYDPDTQRYENRGFWNFDKLPLNLQAGTPAYEEETDAFLSDSFTVTIEKLLSKPPVPYIDSPYTGPSLLISKSASEAFLNFESTYLNLNFAIECADPAKAFLKLSDSLSSLSSDPAMGRLQNLAETYEKDRSLFLAMKVLSYGFITLLSLIAIANCFNTVSTNLSLRRKDFAMLRSVGLGEKAFWKMLFFEGLICAVRSILYGTALSLLAGFCLYRIMLIGLDVRFIIPYQGIALGAAGSFAVIFLTILFAGRKLRKAGIMEELKMN